MEAKPSANSTVPTEKTNSPDPSRGGLPRYSASIHPIRTPSSTSKARRKPFVAVVRSIPPGNVYTISRRKGSRRTPKTPTERYTRRASRASTEAPSRNVTVSVRMSNINKKRARCIKSLYPPARRHVDSLPRISVSKHVEDGKSVSNVRVWILRVLRGIRQRATVS
jgi:hypothetical protein